MRLTLMNATRRMNACTPSNIATGATMGISRFRKSASFLALSVALLAIGEIPTHAATATSDVYGNCQDIKKAMPGAGDGNYILYDNNTLFTVYCYDMSSTPSEYITLAETAPNQNYSQYTAGGASPGTNVRTTFTKLRIDPATMMVDIGDLTFASSVGSTSNGATAITSMPYGVAMSCTEPQGAYGTANINLEDTPFQVDNTFTVGGYLAAGSANVSQNNQVVNLTGGGYCGWITPAPYIYNPYNPKPGMYHLQLSCTQDPVVTPNGEFCVKLG
jgi:hypothetical protein